MAWMNGIFSALMALTVFLLVAAITVWPAYFKWTPVRWILWGAFGISILIGLYLVMQQPPPSHPDGLMGAGLEVIRAMLIAGVFFLLSLVRLALHLMYRRSPSEKNKRIRDSVAANLVVAGCTFIVLVIATFAYSRLRPMYSKTNVPQDWNGTVVIDTSKPIPFDQHNFDAHCFDTYGCTVLYNNRYMAHDPDDEKRPPSSSMGDRFPEGLSAGNINLPNYPHFPPPAKATWRSADGQPHEAQVDFETIFKDKTVIHRVPQEQLPPVINMPIFPDIVLVVDDRTIDVYMRARVPTKDLQIPGNVHSRFRDDMIKVYSKIY